MRDPEKLGKNLRKIIRDALRRVCLKKADNDFPREPALIGCEKADYRFREIRASRELGSVARDFERKRP